MLFRLRALTRLMVPNSVLRERARSMARRQFVEQNVVHTAGATGVLLFVSELEHYVELIADYGIAEKVSDEQWQTIVDAFIDKVKAGDSLSGFLSAIESCGELLELHLPRTSLRNELPDH